MGDEDEITSRDELNANFFYALSRNDDDEVIRLCNNEAKDHKGPLYNMALHASTVLHMACFLEKFDLANKLLEIVYEDYSSFDEDEIFRKLSEAKNAWGNTILHDASTSNLNQGIEFVKKLLKRFPQLLEVKNEWGESPLLQSLRLGQGRMYKFLVAEVERFCDIRGYHDDSDRRLKFLQRKDKMTILHMAVLTRKFDIALHIAKTYPELHHVKDSNHNMTALQMLARSPTAFKSGTKLGPLQKLIYSIVSTDEQDTTTEVGMIGCRFPMIEEVRRLKKGNEDALKLAKKLIETDASWKKTFMPLDTKEQPASHDDMQPSNETTQNGVGNDDEIPLFLAIKKGCTEIVEEILDIYPQAVDYMNNDQENLFHVAVRSRNQDIISMMVSNNKLVRRGQLEAVDKYYNTIMHKVGYKPFILVEDLNKDTKEKENPTKLTTAEQVLMDTTTKTPLQYLSNELRLLESLEKLCPSYMINYRNNKNLTARELFAMKNADLREKAKEYLKQTAEHCTVVTILIATVAFAAAYTVPGGPDDRTGLPVLLGQPLFLVFTVTDVLSLGFGLTAVVIFLTILTSQFRLKDFQRSLPQRLVLGLTLLFLSVSMMMVSFAATIILTINTKQNWTKIALYIVSFFPVIIFMSSYIPFYKELLETLNSCMIRIGKSLPKPRCGQNLEGASSSDIYP